MDRSAGLLSGAQRTDLKELWLTHPFKSDTRPQGACIGEAWSFTLPRLKSHCTEEFLSWTWENSSNWKRSGMNFVGITHSSHYSLKLMKIATQKIVTSDCLLGWGAWHLDTSWAHRWEDSCVFRLAFFSQIFYSFKSLIYVWNDP